jgi:heme/copper-type cytochrome/quinol oxidase subunit 2
MRRFVKVLVLVIPVLLLAGFVVLSYKFYTFYNKAEIQVVTEITPVQADAIQKEFGFTLPEGARIVQCRYAGSRDRLFTVVITGVTDEDMFIQNCIQFEVEEPYERKQLPYYEFEHRDIDKMIPAKYYFGMSNGSSRGIYIYYKGTEMIIDIEKGGIVSPELVKMFGV